MLEVNVLLSLRGHEHLNARNEKHIFSCKMCILKKYKENGNLYEEIRSANEKNRN